MTGLCRHCRVKTMARPGAERDVARRFPPVGFRLGWCIENASVTYLICWKCAEQALHIAA